MEPAIRVEDLGKLYRVTQRGERAAYTTLRESLTRAAGAPFRWARQGFAPPDPAEDFWALKGVNFEVQPGEVVGIIGRNGAGKSTLLKILSRITKPTTGRVTLNGRVGSLLEVGTGFHPELTGRENVYLNGSILGMARREIAAKFDEIVAFAEVERFLDTPVKRYSSGMYVRLAFAVAAHLEPEILIVDEVLAVGDAAFQQKCLGKMSDLASCGRTILFVSHQMSAVQSLCSHAVLMERGRVRGFGPKTRIIADYIDSGSEASAVGEWIGLDSDQRSSRERAWFTGVRYGNEVAEASHRLFPEGPANFDVRVFSADSIKPVYIALNLYDRYDTCLIGSNSGRCRIPLYLLPGENIFRFHIESLHLNSGTFRVELWMADGKVVLDTVRNAANVTVSEYVIPNSRFAFGIDGLVPNHFSVETLSTEQDAKAIGNGLRNSLHQSIVQV